jgi:hypothetical protein
MIVFGVGASTYGAKCGEPAFSRFTEVAITTVPAGTSTGPAEPAGRISTVRLNGLLCSPLERGAVGPDAVQDDGDLAGDRDLGLLVRRAGHLGNVGSRKQRSASVSYGLPALSRPTAFLARRQWNIANWPPLARASGGCGSVGRRCGTTGCPAKCAFRSPLTDCYNSLSKDVAPAAAPHRERNA